MIIDQSVLGLICFVVFHAQRVLYQIMFLKTGVFCFNAHIYRFHERECFLFYVGIVMGICIKHEVSSAVLALTTTNVLLPVFLSCPWVLVS